MLEKINRENYESRSSSNQALTFKKTTSYLEGNAFFDLNQKEELGLINREGVYTNLGKLLSDQSTSTLKVGVFNAHSNHCLNEGRLFSGSLLAKMQEASHYIQEFNCLGSTFSGLKRIDTRDYPTEAIRQALVNVILHRDYSVKFPSLIRLFADRMEFVCFGGLVNGAAFDDTMLGLSALRNPKLANIFYRLRLIKSYGVGILKIKECYRKEEQKPKFEVSSHAFKITLPNRNFQKKSR